jgi:hypothetical protein
MKFWLENLQCPLGRHRSRWYDNTKVNIKETGRAIWTGFISSRYGPVAGSRGQDNEATDAIKVRNFLAS